jgi:hypothetical protein
MTQQKVHLYSFLRHLIEKKYSRANQDLEQVVEEKLRSHAFKAKQKINNKTSAKSVSKAKQTSKMIKKDSSEGEKD